MESLHTVMPGYRINEYQLILPPHEELWHKILRVKEEFYKKYQMSGKPTRPHITLARFYGYEMMEEKILQRLQSISMGLTPFKVELKDYASYPTHSIVVPITTRVPVQNLVRELKSAQKLLKLNNEYKPYFLDEPHIPIAVRLKPWQYEGGWMEFSHRQFNGRFIADHMLLLKKRVGERGQQILRRFEFQDLPVKTTQGDLFGNGPTPTLPEGECVRFGLVAQ